MARHFKDNTPGSEDREEEGEKKEEEEEEEKKKEEKEKEEKEEECAVLYFVSHRQIVKVRAAVQIRL